MITGERGDGALTRQGLEEYVSDAVILLDHRVHDQVSTRRLRVVKYRGSHHGTNEYPFLIDADGISVLPVSSLALAARRAAGARVVGRRASRRDAQRPGVLPRQHDPRLRHRRHREDEPGRPLSRRGLPPGRALPVLSLRRVAAAAPPEHALHRHRPRAVGGRRPAAVPRRPAVALRARDASRHDAPGRGGLQADRDRHRPGDQPDDGGHLRRRPGDAHAHDRSPEDREHHRHVDEPHARTDRRSSGPRRPSRR